MYPANRFISCVKTSTSPVILVYEVVEGAPMSLMDARRSVTPKFLEKLTEIINDDPTKSTRRIAEKLNTSNCNV